MKCNKCKTECKCEGVYEAEVVFNDKIDWFFNGSISNYELFLKIKGNGIVINRRYYNRFKGKTVKLRKEDNCGYDYCLVNEVQLFAKEWLRNLRPVSQYVEGEWYLLSFSKDSKFYTFKPYQYKNGYMYECGNDKWGRPALYYELKHLTDTDKQIDWDADIDWLKVERDTGVRNMGDKYYLSDYLSNSAIPFQLYSSKEKRKTASAINNFHHCQLIHKSDVEKYLKEDVKWKSHFFEEVE